jgi:hypothetical protein
MLTILIIWFVLCLFTLILMALTDNWRLYISDILRFLIFKDFASFILSLLVLFVYLPLNITYLIGEIFNKK